MHGNKRMVSPIFDSPNCAKTHFLKTTYKAFLKDIWREVLKRNSNKLEGNTVVSLYIIGDEHKQHEHQ